MKKWKKDSIIEFVEDKGYKFIEFVKFDYSFSKIKIWCGNKDHEPYIVTFYSFRNGSRCNQCYYSKRGSSQRFDINFVRQELTNIGYELLEEEYKNNRTKMNMICSNGHHIQMTFDSIRSGKRCRKCSGSQKHTYDEVKNDIESFSYELLSNEYKNNKEYLSVRCPKGHVYKVKYDHWVIGIRCPKCRESKGERTIYEFLNDYSLNYIREYRFEDCKDINCLPFDFYLPDYNICIEFDGEQHFKSCDFYGGDTAFEIRKKHDIIKTKYCKDNNIKLIRIPYWDYESINEILINELKLIKE